MNRFVVIKNSKIVAERYGDVIAEGEIPDDGTYGEFGQVKSLDGSWIRDPEEVAFFEKQTRINELKEAITLKNLLGDDSTLEKAQLRTLLGM